MSLRPGSVNFDEKWNDVSKTISAVVHLKPVKRVTWNDNISDIYALCVAFPKSFAITLYEQTKILLEEIVTGLSNDFLLLDSRSLLVQYHSQWMMYRQAAHYLDNLFSYFNRVHLNKFRPQDSLDYHVPGITLAPVLPVDPHAPVEIRHMALEVWHNKMIEMLIDRLFVCIMSEISKDRESVDHGNLGVVHDVIHSFIEVCEYNKDKEIEYYQRVFEEEFLKETGAYYRQKAAHLIADLSYSDYLKKSVGLLQSAKLRGEKFLHQSSMIKFIRECQARLLEDQIDYLQSYVPQMVQNEQLVDLSNLFVLFNGMPRALEPVAKELTNRIKEEGIGNIKSFLSLEHSPEVFEFISVILRIHNKYKKMVQNVFSNHKLFLTALDEGCRGFVNYCENPHHQCQSPRMLSRYCDQLLKKGSKSVGDSELEEKMDNVITVFQYIEDKDVFQKYYSRMLSRRLVYSNSMSMEVEENMVQKLKHVCGYQYTARLQRMLMDITLSSNLVMEFNDFLKLQSYSDVVIGFSSLILQSGAWQLTRSPCSTLVLPEEVTSLMTKFEAFYNSRHHGRCLSWLHHFSTGELKILYLKKPYIVTMTTFQMIVMMSFDDEDKPLPLSSLQLKCQLESRELKMTLQSLTDARLLIEHKSEDKTSDDEYSLNLHYSNKRTKFKISSSLQRETQQDIEQTQQMVLEDRKIFIQAAIVRVMKHRKTLKHNQLIEQTILLIRHRFNPNILLIKKCIESLIDKQYIERSPETKDMYHYVA